MASQDFDIAAVRANFPALALNQVFFDNAGGSQALGTVVDSIRDFFLTSNVQLGASYEAGKQANSKHAAGYEATAKYINASRDDVVIGSSTTQLFRNLSQAIKFEPGDELVVSAIDHEANIASWVAAAQTHNLVLKWWKPSPSPNPKLTPENLKPLLTPRTRLVTCTHASNILGTIHDVKAIAAAVHEHRDSSGGGGCPRALICVDGVAYAPHRPIDVADLGVDFYAFSWYKVYGPHIATLYASPRTKSELKSLGHFFNAHDSLENKLGLAGYSYELVAAVPPVLEYLGAAGDARWAGRTRHETELQKLLLGYLAGRDDVVIYGESSGDPAVRLPTISFGVQGWRANDLVDEVQRGSGFGFKRGHFYSWRLVEETLGLDPREGVVRVSMVHYNTTDEVNNLISKLDSVLSSRER